MKRHVTDIANIKMASNIFYNLLLSKNYVCDWYYIYFCMR